MRENEILPFTLQELVELLTRAGDEEDQLTLMLASSAHGIETGVAKGVKKTSVLVFGVLGILLGPLL
jgi:hypothetical protein